MWRKRAVYVAAGTGNLVRPCLVDYFLSLDFAMGSKEVTVAILT